MESFGLKSANVEPLTSEDLRRLIDSIEDYAFYMLDPGGIIVSWNYGAQQITGYEAGEVIGRHVSLFYPSEAQREGLPEQELQKALKEGKTEIQCTRVRKDGSHFPALVKVTPLHDEQGELRGFAKTTRDLSPLHEAQERLRLSEERLLLLVEAVQDYAIYMLDPRGCITTWNAGAERIKGYKASEVIGQHYSLFFVEEDVRAGKPEAELELSLSQGKYEEEGYRVRKNGERFLASVALTPIRNHADELVGFAKVTRDLTERVETERIARKLMWEQAARTAAQAAEAQIRKSAEQARASALQAEEANRVKDEFLATVSHELRTPLNAIVGWSALLQGRAMTPSVAKGVDVIHRNALAQAKLIDDILDVSRIITGKLRLDLRVTDLAVVVQDAIEVISPSASAKQIHIDYAPPSAHECTLVGDPERLQQVVWNLLSNAVKFSERSSHIKVSLKQAESALVLSVRDAGRGIESDFLPYVFDRFVQGDTSSTRRVGGLGLGLAIVRHLVELHGGQVSVESEGVGHGATFSAILPIRATAPFDLEASDAEAGHGALEASDNVIDLKGAKVLVVDDERDARELLQAMLLDAGARVETAASVKEGLLAYRYFAPDVLVSDIGMSEEDGYSFMRRLKEQAQARGTTVAPAIALTAYTRTQDQDRALTAGFSRHLGKPVNPLDFLSTVACLVETSAEES